MTTSRARLRAVTPVFEAYDVVELEEPLPRRSQKRALRLIAGFAVFVYAIFILRTGFQIDGTAYFTLIDDAMISMRYGEHLAQGHGLVWNIGEAPIEGFSNLGWTLYMALLHLLPVSAAKISLLVMATSAAILIAVALLGYALVKTLEPQRDIAPIVAAALLSLYFPLVFWSLRGMEVGAAVLSLQVAVLFAFRLARSPNAASAIAVGLACLVAVLIRLDLLLQVALILTYLAASPAVRQSPRCLAPVLLLALGGALAVLAFQYVYFDSLLPNTYYLKVDGVSLRERLDVGIQVLIEYASRDFLMLAIVSAAGFVLYSALRTREYVLLASLFGAQVLYSVYVGGDYAEPFPTPQVDAANRFITQGMPFLVVLFAIVCDRLVAEFAERRTGGLGLSPRSRAWLTVGISVLALAVMSGQPWARWGWTHAPLLDHDIAKARLGVLIKETTPPDASIAVHGAGQLSYFSERRSIDLLGKSDAVIAHGPPAGPFRPGHNKWDYDYSISVLKPDIVADVWGTSNTFLTRRPSEYKRLPNQVFVRETSTGIDLEKLGKQYR